MEIYAPPQEADSLPVIDISGPETEVAAQIRAACLDTGFFYAAGHGIAPELVAGQFAAARRFFAVPAAEKAALDMRHSALVCGYEALCGQVLDSQDGGTEAPPDLKEAYYCCTNLADDNPSARSPARVVGSNQWPAGLAAEVAHTRAYGEAVQALGDRLLELLALSLDLPRAWFSPFFAGSPAKLRFIRYPPQAADAAFNQIGAGAHTDWGGITVLAQDELGGLEVRDRQGRWIKATPVEGTFVINLGDLMARWTNGVYASNMHRVLNNAAARDRYSMPFFYSPHDEATIAPIASCISVDNPPRFDVCSAGEHMREMFRRSYGY
ncbi:MAG TPA: 2-oxoglutarate and iron-dependent oxygenase domain-containing protein [Novosphingobium sp.]|nr:2-oxoglutarate and iron-dependent oxygenase domain-containing protein [Novosphingobium sp.]